MNYVGRHTNKFQEFHLISFIIFYLKYIINICQLQDKKKFNLLYSLSTKFKNK